MAIFEKYKAWLNSKVNGPRQDAEEEDARIAEQAEAEARAEGEADQSGQSGRVTGSGRRT